MIYECEYGQNFQLRFFMIKRGAVDFAVSADWTPASGDVKISQDGAAFATTANLPTAIGGAGSAGWNLQVNGGELVYKECLIQIIDAATKLVEDNGFLIRTYGHANAFYVMNRSKFRGVTTFTCTTGGTTSSVPISTSNPTITVADQFKGLVLKFDDNTTTAALRNQGARILSHTSGGVITLQDTLTTAPVSGDTGGIY